MGSDMQRREFIGLIGGGAAAVSPFAAHGQQAVPVIGFIYAGATSSGPAAFVAAFRQGLSEAGFVEGKNLAVEYRYSTGEDPENWLVWWPSSCTDRWPCSSRNTPPAVAAKTATSTTPYCLRDGADPVKLGLVASFNRPGGNATGVSFLSAALEAKRLRNATRTSTSRDGHCCAGRPEFCHQR